MYHCFQFTSTIRPFIDISFLIHVIGMHYNLTFEVYQIDQKSDEILDRTLIDKVNYSLNPLSKAHKVFIWNSRL